MCNLLGQRRRWCKYADLFSHFLWPPDFQTALMPVGKWSSIYVFLLSCLMLVKECNCWKVLPIPHPAWQLQSVSLCTRPAGGGLSSNLPFSHVDIFLWFPSCVGWMRDLSPPVLLARSICAPPPWTLSLFSSLESIHYKNKVQDRFNFLSEMQRPLRISSLPSLLAPVWRWGQHGGPACDYSHMGISLVLGAANRRKRRGVHG